jgi:hypothetical protein
VRAVRDAIGDEVKTVPALLLAGLFSTSAMACDKVEATRVQFMLSEMGAVWSEQADTVTLEWGWEWEGAAPGKRLALLRTFTEGDACLTGRTREISFYRKGKRVGIASPQLGVQLLHDPAGAQASMASVAGCP